MPKYKVLLIIKAQKQLDKFSEIIAQPIFFAIKDLQNNARPIGYKN